MSTNDRTPCACVSDSLCGSCTVILMDDLRVISGQIGTYPFRTLLEELDVTITKTDVIKAMNVGPVTTGDDTQPMAYNEEASEASQRVKQVLRAVWGRMCRQYDHLTRGLPAEEIATSLMLVSSLLRDHPNVHQLARLLRSAVTTAHGAIDRPSDRKYLGVCDGRIQGSNCGRSLYSDDLTPETGRCRLCGTKFDVAAKRMDILRVLENSLATTAELEGLEWPGGATLTKSAIRGMKFEGKLRSWGKSARGADLFRVGDVTAIMNARLSP